jgi:hypothetical protein
MKRGAVGQSPTPLSDSRLYRRLLTGARVELAQQGPRREDTKVVDHQPPLVRRLVFGSVRTLPGHPTRLSAHPRTGNDVKGWDTKRGRKVSLWDEQPEGHTPGIAGRTPVDAAARFRANVFTSAGPGVENIWFRLQPPEGGRKRRYFWTNEGSDDCGGAAERSESPGSPSREDASAGGERLDKPLRSR